MFFILINLVMMLNWVIAYGYSKLFMNMENIHY